MKEHSYEVWLAWQGNLGKGTETYAAYSRDHTLSQGGRQTIVGSSDPAFRGDKDRWNPEDLLVGAVSACHQLTYLALCARKNVSVLHYADAAIGTMLEENNRGFFTEIVLRPQVVIRAGDDADLAERLHHEAHADCFIASSVNFPVRCEPEIRMEDVPQ